VHKTTILNRIATLQTLGTEAGKDLVLSVTLERRQQPQIPCQNNPRR